MQLQSYTLWLNYRRIPEKVISLTLNSPIYIFHEGAIAWKPLSKTPLTKNFFLQFTFLNSIIFVAFRFSYYFFFSIEKTFCYKKLYIIWYLIFSSLTPPLDFCGFNLGRSVSGYKKKSHGGNFYYKIIFVSVTCNLNLILLS